MFQIQQNESPTTKTLQKVRTLWESTYGKLAQTDFKDLAEVFKAGQLPQLQNFATYEAYFSKYVV